MQQLVGLLKGKEDEEEAVPGEEVRLKKVNKAEKEE